MAGGIVRTERCNDAADPCDEDPGVNGTVPGLLAACVLLVLRPNGALNAVGGSVGAIDGG